MQPCQISTLPPQHSERALLSCHIVHKDVHILCARKPTYNLAVHPRDRLKFVRPILRVMRPRNPRSCMGSPLGGHTIAGIFHLRHSYLLSQRDQHRYANAYFAIACVSSGFRGLYFFASSGVEITSSGFGFTAFSTSTPIT